MSYEQLKHVIGLTCSDKMVARTLYKAGFQRFVAQTKPYLSTETKTKRLQWALDHQIWNVHDWMRVIWTDESAFHKGGPQRMFVTRKRGQADLLECQKPRFSKPAFTMVWGAILGFGRSNLVIWDKKNHGNINSRGYIDHILPVSLIYIYSINLLMETTKNSKDSMPNTPPNFTTFIWMIASWLMGIWTYNLCRIIPGYILRQLQWQQSKKKAY